MKLERKTKIIISVTIALIIVALVAGNLIIQANKPVGPGRMNNCNLYGGLCQTSCDPKIGSLPDGTCKDDLMCCKIVTNNQ